MADDKKLIWLVNHVAGMRVAQKNAIGPDKYYFHEFHSENEASRRLDEGAKQPDLIITSGTNIINKANGIPVIEASGVDVKQLKAKIEEILPTETYVKASIGR